MTEFNSDLLDEYCEEEFGHTDWAMSWDAQGNMVITFFKEARQDYIDDESEEEEEEDE